MKRIAWVLLFLLVISALFAQNRDTLTLSYYNSVNYYWDIPGANNFTEIGVRYTAPAACTLTSWDLMIYQTVGSPTGIVVHVYEDNGGDLGAELGSVTVPIADIVFYSTWNIIDFTSQNIAFDAGETFFITYTIPNGASGVTEVDPLTDNGASATDNTYLMYNGAWYSFGTLYGTSYEMVAECTIETTGTVGPILQLSPSACDFGQTAIGGGKFQVFTLSNVGGGSLGVQDITFAGSEDMYEYVASGVTFPAYLLSGESLSFIVDYYPSDVGDDSGVVTVTIDDRETHTVNIAGSGYVHNSWAQPGAIFDQSPTGNQGDNTWSMSTSDLAPAYLHAENFNGLTEDIASIDFWGINWYHDGSGWVQIATEDPMTFDIEFWTSDANGLPSVAQHVYTPTITRETVVDSLFSSGPVYKYHYELPEPITMAEGWVSIQGTSVGVPDDAWFLWSTSPIGDCFNAQFSASWAWTEDDLAFALYPPEGVNAPENVKIEMIGDNPRLSWTAQPGCSYIVYRSDTVDGVFNIIGTTTNTEFTDTTVTTDRCYYYVTSETAPARSAGAAQRIRPASNIEPMRFDRQMTR